ncbi:MAG: alcohol dehydrogenase catalytic domain-containing protein [Bacteroidales bacterium]|nr:alcohol dehydrogenase catalytic domain-containing protein [Bacteroidales bacterium]
MRSFQLTGLRQMEMKEVPEPEMRSPHDVLICMKAVGVCGSDIHYYLTGHIGNQVVNYPFTVGHEGAGLVEAVGPQVTRVKPGDKVAIDPAMPCGVCDQCRAGRSHTCRNMKFLGTPGQAAGCLSEYVVMPESSLFPLKPDSSYEGGAFSEPLSIGVYAVRLSKGVKGKRIAILGSGPIGMSVLLSSLAYGAETVYMTDKIDERLALAEKSGAAWTGNPDRENVVQEILQQEPVGMDLVFECCGQQEAVNQAVQLLKPGGKMMIIGIPEFDEWHFPVDDFRHKEIAVQNVRRQLNSVQEALDLIESGRVNIAPLITHRYSFEETREAYELVAGYRDGVMKAMIHF